MAVQNSATELPLDLQATVVRPPGQTNRPGRPILRAFGRQLASAALTLFLASIVIFAVLRLIPGDPASVIVGSDASEAAVAAVREDLGLDSPLVAQYLGWIRGVVTGDWGTSYVIGGPISALIGAAAKHTVALTLAALFVALLLTGLVTAAGALSRNRVVQGGVTAFLTVTVAVPAFVSGVILVQLFAVLLPWLPAGGTPPGGYLANPGFSVQYLLLPAICLALPVASTLSRFAINRIRAELGKPYFVTMKALGIPERIIIGRVVLRNALPPVITILGIQVGQLLGSAILVEAIFAWPGLGQLLAQGIAARDYPVVQALLLLAVTVFIGAQLVTSLVQKLLDPVLRDGGSR